MQYNINNYSENDNFIFKKKKLIDIAKNLTKIEYIEI